MVNVSGIFSLEGEMMKDKEFNLSDKIKEHGRVGREWYRLKVPDVKEFIRIILKDIYDKSVDSEEGNRITEKEVEEIINKRAGDKLTK